MLKRCQNLPAGHCVAEVQNVKTGGNLSAGTVLQGCRMFKQCQNLPARHCVAGVEDV